MQTLPVRFGQPACDEGYGPEIDHDIWYRWKPAVAILAGAYAVNTSLMTSVDTKIAIYSGTDCGTSTLLGCNDDACDYQSEVMFSPKPGVEYLIRIGTYFGSGGDGGSGAFSIFGI